MEEGRQRRSARLSALDKWSQERATHGGVLKVEKRAGDVKGAGRGQGVPGKKRGRKKKKLKEVKEVVVNSIETVVGEAGQNLKQDGYLSSAEKASSNASCMPEKRVLELILNILQKKDTHEIFAEPVDSEEVEGYYDIIKDPMDFGTMRAKLQEGMYTTLEQFENDVFLICSNAMHFNSSSTVFFRQARSIQELAKKAFHALRADPENFESEFSSTRRRYFLKKAMKSHENGRSLADAENSGSHSPAKSASGVKSSNLTTDFAVNDRHRSLQGHSGLRNLHEGPMACGPTSLVKKQRTYDLSGFRDGRKPNFVEEERRFTYRPWSSFLSSNESLVSTLYNGPRELFQVIQGNFSYKESLLRFVRDLGPTAQMVAYRKLQRYQNLACNFQIPAMPQAQTSLVASNSVENLQESRISIDNIFCHPSASVNGNDNFSTGTRETFHQNQCSEVPSGSYLPAIRFGDSDTPVAWIPDSSNERLTTTTAASRLSSSPIQSSEVASEFSQSRLLEFMVRNNNSMVTSPSSPFQAMKTCGSSQATDSTRSSCLRTTDGEHQAAAVVVPELNHRLGSAQTGQCSWVRPVLCGPQTVLDMSYLQARLGGMNSWSRNGISGPELPPASVSETMFVGDCERDVGHSLQGEF